MTKSQIPAAGIRFTAYSATVGPYVFVLVQLAPNVLVNPAHIIGVVPSAQAGLTRIMLAHSAPIDIEAGTAEQVSAGILRAIECATATPTGDRAGH